MAKAPYFNIEGNLVIEVDLVERWLHIQAFAAIDINTKRMFEAIADRWSSDMNDWLLHEMERTV